MCPPFLVTMKRVSQSKLSSRTLLQIRQLTAVVAAMPSVVLLLLLGEEIIGKFRKETPQTQTDSCCCWRRLLECMPQCE